MHFEAFFSFTLAIVILITGKFMTLHSATLRKYAIPEPVVGGILCAAIVALIYPLSGVRISFDLEVKDFLLLLFFAGIGLKADIVTLLKGGRPLFVLLALAIVFIFIQNFAAIGMAVLFGMEAKAGLMAGSISLTGGVGTTLAWAPTFVERLGIANALELGVAANTVGLVSACVIGGPMAAFLMRKHRIAPAGEGHHDVGVAYDRQPASKLDYFAVLWAILILNVTVMLGMGINEVLNRGSLTLPAFVSCILAGIAMRNLLPGAIGAGIRRIWPSLDDGFSLLSDLSLGLFLTMALLGLQLWDLKGMLGFIACTLAVQIALAVVYALFVVFRAMGRDYEAVVMSAGFGGIALGSTATAMANMAAVAQRHGPAHRAFIIVPLVCGFFIDIANALIISMFVA